MNSDTNQLAEVYDKILLKENAPEQPTPSANPQEQMYQKIIDELNAIKEAAERCWGMFSKNAPLNQSTHVLPKLQNIHHYLSDMAETLDSNNY